MSPKSADDELASLIREQEQDMKTSNFQPPEPAAVARFDDFSQYLDSQGELVNSKIRPRETGCKVHGLEHMRPARPSWQVRGLLYECAECDREHHRQWRATRKPWKNPSVRARTTEYVRRHRARRKEQRGDS